MRAEAGRSSGCCTGACGAGCRRAHGAIFRRRDSAFRPRIFSCIWCAIAAPRHCRNPPGVVVHASGDVINALSDGRAWLDPAEIVALFEAYRIPIVTTIVADSAEDAAEKAVPLLAEGHAIVVRVFSRDIRHASDVGGVILDLRTKDSVIEAARTVMDRARSARPDAVLQGVTVQPMIVRRAARELILGIADDPTFGPVIVFGRGGPAVEVINDKALALPPLDMNLARELVGRTRVSRLLGGYGDVPAVPADVVPLTLVKLAQMTADIPEVAALDINPMLADESGVLALDARVAIRNPRDCLPGPHEARGQALSVAMGGEPRYATARASCVRCRRTSRWSMASSSGERRGPQAALLPRDEGPARLHRAAHQLDHARDGVCGARSGDRRDDGRGASAFDLARERRICDPAAVRPRVKGSAGR